MRKLVYLVILLWVMNSVGCAAENVVESGNTICPVSGEEIVKGEEIKYEYKGVNYNLCCKMCIKDFEKDPEKYIGKIEEQEEAGAEAEGHEHHH